MTFTRFITVLAIGIAIGVLVLRYGRGRDRPIVYPDKPEPLTPWWTVNASLPAEDIWNWIAG